MKATILDGRQTAFLHAASAIPFIRERFYLTGGTALAGFYLYHRYSEDLDFFSEQEIDVLNLDAALVGLKGTLQPSHVDFQQSYNRNLFFLRFGEDVLKTEFTFFPFARIEKGGRTDGIEIDSLLDIAVNKLFSIYQRVTARDYIDLYCIIQEAQYSIAELIAKAKLKFDWHIDPLQLGTQFLKSREATDIPRMVKHIEPVVWRAFSFPPG